MIFPRNASIGVGMCPPGEWRKLSKNSWVQSMSPYGYKILDIRMLPDPSRTIEISTEEGIFFNHSWMDVEYCEFHVWYMPDFLGHALCLCRVFVSSTSVFGFGDDYDDDSPFCERVCGFLLWWCDDIGYHGGDIDGSFPGNISPSNLLFSSNACRFSFCWIAIS